MLAPQFVSRAHNAVCAIGYLTVPLEKWTKAPDVHPLQVIGTGFLVGPSTVMTNSHVIEHLHTKAEEREIPDSQLFTSFTAPSRFPLPMGTVRMIRRPHAVDSPRLDIALFEIQAEPRFHFTDIEPLEISHPSVPVVSEEVFVCGFPYGNMLLDKIGESPRRGPLIQQGYVSGLSPHSGAETPEEILLDVRTANNMSGSPVLKSSSGLVIGIHHRGVADSRGAPTTSFAIPLGREQVARWLVDFSEERDSR